jgi:hypothetical protein
MVWTRDVERSLLIDRETGASWTLEGVEATVWDLLVLGYPYPKVTGILAALLGRPAEKAEEFLAQTLAEWHREGIVEVAGKEQDG